MPVCLGLGTGAFFKMVGAVTGVVGAAGGLAVNSGPVAGVPVP
jgi:nitrate/nitrite transporter NarK